MKTNTAFQRAMLSLSHPVSIGAIVLLLLNDHLWRRFAPSWFTGKIGDFAWLIFAPFLLAAMLAWLPKRADFVGRASIIVTGLVFALAKTIPAFHALTIKVLETLTGWPNVLRMDPTDLITLPALLIAWLIWKQSAARSIRWPKRGWILLPLAALATMANEPAPPTGVRALGATDSILYTQDFHSEDGGLTWREGGRKELQRYASRDNAWQLTDPANERVQYRFTPGLSIERSEDGGQTWRREFDLGGEEARIASTSSFWGIGPFDAIFHPASGNLIVAMGLEGVLVRLPDGEWRWVSVGNFSVPQLNRLEQIIALISGEIWLGAALIGLIVAAGLVRRRGRVDGVLGAIAILTWIGWAFTLIRFPPAMGSGGPFVNLAAFAVPATVILAAIVCMWQANKIYRQNQRALLTVFVIAVSGALLYLLPYVLWTQGAIPFYATATNWAIGLALAATFAANRFIHSHIELLPPETLQPLEHKSPPSPAALKKADTYYTHGVGYYDADDYDAALAEFDQAIQLNPDHADAYLYRGLTHYAKDNYKLAIADLDAAMSYKPHDAEIYYWRGCVYADLGDRPKAIFALENAMRGNLEPELRKEAEALIDQLQH